MIVVGDIFLWVIRVYSLTFTITLYRSNAIIIMVHIDVFPNNDPVIAYKAHAVGPDTQRILWRFVWQNYKRNVRMKYYQEPMFRWNSSLSSLDTCRTSYKSQRTPSSRRISWMVFVMIWSSWKHRQLNHCQKTIKNPA